MRVLFFFFLLINAAYLYMQSGWLNDPDKVLVVKPLTMPPGVETLALLRERGLSASRDVAIISETEKMSQNLTTQKIPAIVDPQKMLPAERESKPIISADKQPLLKTTKSSASVCFTLGPFVQTTQASRAAKATSALGINVSRRQESRRTPKGYWVYLPASGSYQSALRKVREMKKKGIKDLFIMGKGTKKNAISLGLFKKQSTAKQRHQQIKKLGLKAIIETQYRETKQVWLDMSVAGDKTVVIADLTEMAGTFSGANLSQRKCKK